MPHIKIVDLILLGQYSDQDLYLDLQFAHKDFVIKDSRLKAVYTLSIKGLWHTYGGHMPKLQSLTVGHGVAEMHFLKNVTTCQG